MTKLPGFLEKFKKILKIDNLEKFKIPSVFVPLYNCPNE